MNLKLFSLVGRNNVVPNLWYLPTDHNIVNNIWTETHLLSVWVWITNSTCWSLNPCLFFSIHRCQECHWRVVCYVPVSDAQVLSLRHSGLHCHHLLTCSHSTVQLYTDTGAASTYVHSTNVHMGIFWSQNLRMTSNQYWNPVFQNRNALNIMFAMSRRHSKRLFLTMHNMKHYGNIF